MTTVRPLNQFADLHFEHQQIASSAVWTVVHNLNKKVSVTVVDTADTVVIGDVIYLDANTVELHFSVPFSGTAYLN